MRVLNIAGSVLGLGFLLATTSLDAQVLGMPLVNSGAVTGISVGADMGFPNDDAGDFSAIGVNASVGIGLVGVRGSLSRVSSDGQDAIWARGASATLRIFGGPLIPIRAMLLGGYGTWKVGETSTTRMPVSFGVAATIPNPAFSIKPWIAPRVEWERTTINGDTDNDSNFGISGGIDVSLLSGFSIRAAYDRMFVKGLKPGILSVGVGFTL